jgi:hypothetical protein
MMKSGLDVDTKKPAQLAEKQTSLLIQYAGGGLGGN